MVKQEELAKLVYQLVQDGIEIGDFSVTADGVFFRTHRPADIFSQKHGKQLVRVDGWMSGWLAKEPEESRP